MDKRIINMEVSPDETGNKLTSAQNIVGYSGEHLATELQFKIPATWSADDTLLYYVSFYTASGKAYKTELQKWPVSVELPAAVTYEGTLLVQIIAVAENEPIEVKKSSVCACVIGKSLNGTGSLPEDATAGLIEQSIKEFGAAVEEMQRISALTPYIGDNGNWYVYNAKSGGYEDTGKSSKGEKGDMGELADGSVIGIKLGYYSVSRDKIAPEAVNEEKISSGAITPQKFANETKSVFANTLLGYADGDIARIAGGIPDTMLQSAVVRGRSAVNEAAGTITPLSPSVVVASSNDGTIENHVNLPEGLQLYSTPNDQYYDTYDVITGVLTRNCTVFAMSSGFIYGYSQSVESIVWITDPLFIGSKSYYLVKGGTVTSSATDWQGKIQIVIPKTDAGITSTDTSAQAREKMLAYWGSAYAILPLKTPSVEQYEGVQLAIPTKECAVVCNNAYMDVTYCRDINVAWKELRDYVTDLQRHIALLEAKG